jgi:hypothetical protein
VFKSVNFLFLVRGHTKNPCDRMFNILKLRFRKQNVYTMEQLLEVLNEQDQVNAMRVLPSDFFGIDAFLDKFYRRFTSGTVHKAHIFSCSVENGATKMKINVSQWELEDEPQVDTDLRKLARYTNFGDRTREEAMDEFNPLLLEAPGVPAIKRCELYNKYRPLVPLPFRDIICPKPPQEVLDNQKKIKNDKVRAKANAKKKKSLLERTMRRRRRQQRMRREKMVKRSKAKMWGNMLLWQRRQQLDHRLHCLFLRWQLLLHHKHHPLINPCRHG